MVDEQLIPTGLKELDELIGGFELGELVILGSLPGMGKKELLINMGLSASQSYPFMFVPLDYSPATFKKRLLASVSQVASRNIIRKTLSIEERLKIDNTVRETEKLSFFVAECPFSSLDELLIFCKNQIEKQDIKVIVLDSFTSIAFYCKPDFEKWRDNNVINEICYKLSVFAKEQHVCIILTTSISSQSVPWGSEKPSFQDLPGKELMLEHAAKVLLLHRYNYFGILRATDGHDVANEVLLSIIKNSSGAIGECQVIYKINELPF
jgi:replicative DNA helicase